jgi:hypothetical protein
MRIALINVYDDDNRTESDIGRAALLTRRVAEALLLRVARHRRHPGRPS